MKFIRILTLAAIAVGVLALPAAASASGGFAVEAYPASVHASGGQFVLANGSFREECTTPVLDGTLKAPAHSLSLKVTENGKCNLWEQTFRMNGCEIILHPGSETADIGPPGCGPPKIWIGCEVSVGPQAGLSATYTGPELTKGVKQATGVEISGTVPLSPGCAGSTATLTANWTLSTTNEAKQSVGLTEFHDFVPIGISLTNEKHPRTTAQAFPVAMTGSHGAPDTVISPVEKLGSVAINTKCLGANLGAGELTKEIESVFSLSGTYYGKQGYPTSEFCESVIGNVRVHMNSCRYELPEIEQSGASYGAKGSSIVCTKEGDAISLESVTIPCNIYIPPQALAATLVNSGPGWGADILLNLSSSSLKYTTTGVGCSAGGIPSSGENGVMKQEITLHGTLPG